MTMTIYLDASGYNIARFSPGCATFVGGSQTSSYVILNPKRARQESPHTPYLLLGFLFQKRKALRPQLLQTTISFKYSVGVSCRTPVYPLRVGVARSPPPNKDAVPNTTLFAFKFGVSFLELNIMEKGTLFLSGCWGTW